METLVPDKRFPPDYPWLEHRTKNSLLSRSCHPSYPEGVVQLYSTLSFKIRNLADADHTSSYAELRSSLDKRVCLVTTRCLAPQQRPLTMEAIEKCKPVKQSLQRLSCTFSLCTIPLHHNCTFCSVCSINLYLLYPQPVLVQLNIAPRRRSPLSGKQGTRLSDVLFT